jgi:hypothetical protein
MHICYQKQPLAHSCCKIECRRGLMNNQGAKSLRIWKWWWSTPSLFLSSKFVPSKPTNTFYYPTIAHFSKHSRNYGP